MLLMFGWSYTLLVVKCFSHFATASKRIGTQQSIHLPWSGRYKFTHDLSDSVAAISGKLQRRPNLFGCPLSLQHIPALTTETKNSKFGGEPVISTIDIRIENGFWNGFWCISQQEHPRCEVRDGFDEVMHNIFSKTSPCNLNKISLCK